MVGPPGTGKTLLAMRLPGIMPPLTDSESAEVAAVESISQAGFSLSRWRRRPFRAPHHSASAAAMVGGGRQARPGEISLAHHGVLFLDELPEFERRVLEVLREPLESGAMELSRVDYKVRLPASFQLVAAMNPCPCGYLGSPKCICSRTQIERYRTRISGPLLDRIDLHVAVNQQPTSVLQRQTSGEASAVVAARVAQTRDVQGSRGAINAHLGGESLARYCALKDQDAAFFVDAADNLGLSARSCHRVLRVARTIADMAAAAEIDRTHLLEALSYRAVSSV